MSSRHNNKVFTNIGQREILFYSWDFSPFLRLLRGGCKVLFDLSNEVLQTYYSYIDFEFVTFFNNHLDFTWKFCEGMFYGNSWESMSTVHFIIIDIALLWVWKLSSFNFTFGITFTFNIFELHKTIYGCNLLSWEICKLADSVRFCTAQDCAQ